MGWEYECRVAPANVLQTLADAITRAGVYDVTLNGADGFTLLRKGALVDHDSWHDADVRLTGDRLYVCFHSGPEPQLRALMLEALKAAGQSVELEEL